jgi:hypothetical protein
MEQACDPVIVRCRCAYCGELIPRERLQYVWERTGSLPAYCDPLHRKAAENARARARKKHGEIRAVPAPQRERETIVTPQGKYDVVDLDYNVDGESIFTTNGAQVRYGSIQVPCANWEVAEILNEAQRVKQHIVRNPCLFGVYERPLQGFDFEPEELLDPDGTEAPHVV